MLAGLSLNGVLGVFWSCGYVLLGVRIFRIGGVYSFGVLGASSSCQIEPFYFVLFPCIPWVIVIKF